MPPVISVIIPTYNRSAQLPAAIASILGQTFKDLELIVVDDGSTDETAESIRPHLREARLRYEVRTNLGRSAARNFGAGLAQGQWLAFLDSDDRLLPHALAAHLAALNEQPLVAMTLGGNEYVDNLGRRLGERRPWNESSLTVPNWLFNCMGVPGTVMIRRDWFDRVKGFDETFHMSEDWDLFLRLAQAGCPMSWTQAMVCQYWQHAGNSIHDLALHRESSLRVLDKFFKQADLPLPVASLAQRAKAWVHVIFARRGFAAGFGESASQDLGRALALDPALAGERRLELLECLFTPEPLSQLAEQDMESAVSPYLPPALQRHPAAIRQARARAHMARFFAAAGHPAGGRASAHLRAGLRQDARWLFNRGVLAYCVRLALGRRASGPPNG